jgi:hypothetical protein
MYQLHSAGGCISVFKFIANGKNTGIGKNRPDPLAALQGGVLHGGRQPLTANLVAEVSCQGAFYTLLALLQECLQRRRGGEIH